MKIEAQAGRVALVLESTLEVQQIAGLLTVALDVIRDDGIVLIEMGGQHFTAVNMSLLYTAVAGLAGSTKIEEFQLGNDDKQADTIKTNHSAIGLLAMALIRDGFTIFEGRDVVEHLPPHIQESFRRKMGGK